MFGMGLFGLTQKAPFLRNTLVAYHFDIIAVLSLLVAMHFGLDDRFAIVAISVLVFTTSADGGKLSKLLKIPLIQKLGDISYSVYLNHAVILLAIVPIFDKAFADKTGHLTPITAAIQFMIFLGLTLGGSVLTYKYLELPSGRYVTRKLLGLGRLGERQTAPAELYHRAL